MLDGQLVLDNNAQLESSNSKYTNLIAYFWSPFTYNGPNTQITGTIQLYKPFNANIYNHSMIFLNLTNITPNSTIRLGFMTYGIESNDTTVYNNSNNKNNHIYDALNCDYLVYT